MSTNTIIHRIVRPAVRAAAPSGVTPNQVTTARLISGIAAAIAFAQGGGWADLGGAIFLFSMLLDRADGELARQTKQSSLAGHRYDLCSDCFSNVIAFIAIGWGAMGPMGVLLGVIAGCGIAALFWQLNVLKLGDLSGWNLAPGITLDPDDLMALVPVLVWLGATTPMLWAAAVVTPVAALYLGLAGKSRAAV